MLSLQKIGCGSAKLSKLFCVHLALSLQKIGCTLAFRASSIPNESINYSISDTNDDTQDAPPGSPLPVPRGRSCRGATEDRVLDAFCIGNIGFIQAKCEMFSASAKYVKENSPFALTAVIASNNTYIPTEEAYTEYRCYESDTSLFVKGSAEEMSKEFVDMLNSLK